MQVKDRLEGVKKRPALAFHTASLSTVGSCYTSFDVRVRYTGHTQIPDHKYPKGAVRRNVSYRVVSRILHRMGISLFVGQRAVYGELVNFPIQSKMSRRDRWSINGTS